MNLYCQALCLHLTSNCDQMIQHWPNELTHLKRYHFQTERYQLIQNIIMIKWTHTSENTVMTKWTLMFKGITFNNQLIPLLTTLTSLTHSLRLAPSPTSEFWNHPLHKSKNLNPFETLILVFSLFRTLKSSIAD